MKLNKLFAIITLIAVLFVFTASASADTFYMGIDAEYPPFSYLNDDGSYDGFDVQMCMAVCARLGWDLEIVPIDWTTKLISLDAGEIDCVWSGMTKLDSMVEAGYTLSFTYYDNTQVVLTRTDTGITTLADLSGRIVGVQAGTSADIMLQEGGDQADLALTFDGGEPMRFSDYNTCFVELMAGSIDAIILDKPVAENKVDTYGDTYVILAEDLGSEEYGIAFRGSDTEMCAAVEAAYLELVADGTYAALGERFAVSDGLCLKAE